MATSPDIFQPTNEEIVDDIIKELRLQGHHLTGALEASIKPKELREGDNIVLSAQALSYLKDLEEGIPANQISIDATSVAEMTRYVNLRMGYTGKYAEKVALLILKKQQKEGNPTRSSYQYSKTGFRTEAVRDSFETNQDRYIGMLDDAAIGELDKNFSSIKSGTV